MKSLRKAGWLDGWVPAGSCIAGRCPARITWASPCCAAACHCGACPKSRLSSAGARTFKSCVALWHKHKSVTFQTQKI